VNFSHIPEYEFLGCDTFLPQSSACPAARPRAPLAAVTGFPATHPDKGRPSLAQWPTPLLLSEFDFSRCVDISRVPSRCHRYTLCRVMQRCWSPTTVPRSPHPNQEPRDKSRPIGVVSKSLSLLASRCASFAACS
jgi:hypothetical protein